MAPPKNQAKLLAALQEAIALHNNGRLDEADAIYRNILRQSPRHPDALHLRALICHSRGNFSEAASLAEAAIAFAPRVANLHNTAGEAWRRLGKLDLARKRLAEAIRLEPAMAIAHHNLSMVCSAESRYRDAWQSNRRALEINPDYPEALIHALSIACAMDDGQQASLLAARVEKLAGHAAAQSALAIYHCHRARRHFKELQFADGDQAAAMAIAKDPTHLGGWVLRGEASLERMDFAQAELFCVIAANLAPEDEEARRNLALIFKNQKRLDEASEHLTAWLEEHPDDAEARFALATIALMKEDYANGWANYEARWQSTMRDHAKFAGTPQWNGLAADRLLLYAEQGLGDTVQMLRFVPEARSRCRDVVLQVPSSLLRIAQRFFAADGVTVVSEIPDTPFDAACPLMSLPLALGADSPERVGGKFPYLAAWPKRIADFSARLSNHPGRKLGFVWQGSKASRVNRQRMLPEAELAPLLELPGWTPVSLQFGVKDPTIAGHRLLDLSAEISDFEDLAAAMMAVDAIVSLDTGPAHLAGALGVPTYTLLPWLHDWRWGSEGRRCSWYPDMELFRQPVGGSWRAPIAELAAMLGGRPAGGDKGDPNTSPTRPIVDCHFPLVRTACRHGIYILPLLDPRATRSLLAYGEYQAGEAEVLCSLLGPGDTVVEVGSNLGALTLPLAQTVGPTGRMVVLEPQSLPHRCLAETLAANSLPWVEARQEAAGASAGVIKPGQSVAGPEPAKKIRLDDLGLAACQLIKIDAEGSELDILKGASRLIDTHHPVLYIKCGPGEAVAPLLAFLKQAGYRTFRHEAPLFSARNYRGCTADLFRGEVASHWLALPPGTTPPDAVIAV